MQGKLNAYATIMAGRPVMRTTTTTTCVPIKREEPKHNTLKVCTGNVGFNLWQWFKK